MYDTEPARIFTLRRWCTAWYTIWTITTIIIGITSKPMGVDGYLALVDRYSNEFNNLSAGHVSSLDMTLTITDNNNAHEGIIEGTQLKTTQDIVRTLDKDILLYLHGITEKSVHFKYILSLVVFLSGLSMSTSSQFYNNSSVIKNHTCLLVLQILHGCLFWSWLYSEHFIEHIMIWWCCLQTGIQIVMAINAAARDGIPNIYGLSQ